MSCGLCLKDSAMPLDIRKNIAAVLKKHLWFTAFPDDFSLICTQCWTEINRFDEFYETVKQLHDGKLNKLEDNTDLDKTYKNSEYSDSYVTVLVNETDFCDYEYETFTCENQEDALIRLDIEQNNIENDRRDSKASNSSIHQKEIEIASESLFKSKSAVRANSTSEDDKIISKHLSLNCELCNFEAAVFQEIIKHFEINHTGTRPFINCCGRRFTKRERVIQHAWLHEDPKHFQCLICQRVFRDNEIKNAHMKAQHPAEEELIYGCDQCEKRYARRYLLKLHKAVHVPVDERQFFCHKCKPTKSFASQNQLNIHNSMSHNRASNICDVCGKTIRDRLAFKKHLRLHFEASGPRVKCPHPGCESWLKDRDNLKQHLRLHKDNVQSFKCDECDKLCKDRRAFTCHKRYVHPTILLSCEVCSKTFKKSISLREHMATHTGEALYECPFCTQKFKSNANMHAHKKKIHPEEWKFCKKLRNR